MNLFAFFSVLCACHAIADYPLQGDWLAKAKNHRINVVPGECIWPIALASHASIHALFVGAVTGSMTLGVIEFVAHSAIDWMKCDGRISYNADQAAHIACKALYVIALSTAIL